MRFEWKYNLNTEIRRLIFTANYISWGFYQKKGLLLTEKKLNNKQYLLQVIFPFRKLSSQVWKKLQEKEIHVDEGNIEKEIIEEFTNKYNDIELISSKKIRAAQESWRQKEGKFIEIVNQLFPNLKIKAVTIIPTEFGTDGSYNVESNGIMKIQPRIDSIHYGIIPLIVKCIVRNHLCYRNLNDKKLHNKIWDTIEQITNFLIRSTDICTLISDYQDHFADSTDLEVDLNLLEKSNKYYEKLGFPQQKSLHMSQNQILCFHKPLIKLTATQHNLLRNFLQNQNKMISFDEIAAIMWGENYYDKFSLAAMSKMIFQLRQKLKDAGLQKEVIFTKRRRGYVLVQ